MAMTELEAWIKRHEREPGAILEAAERFRVTPKDVRTAYDHVFRLPVEGEIRKERIMGKHGNNIERANAYARSREEGANPDEAAQAADWKNFASAKASLAKAGIKISTQPPYLLDSEAQPRKPATINPKLEEALPKLEKPESENDSATLENDNALIPGRMVPEAQSDKTSSLLRCWTSVETDLLYIDLGESIEIRPITGDSIVLTPSLLKQFSEELQELLEIIK